MLNDIIRKLDKTDNDLYVTVILGFLRTHENTKVVFFAQGARPTAKRVFLVIFT